MNSLPSSNDLLSFFFNDTAATEIYTLSLHDALPIYDAVVVSALGVIVEITSVPKLLDIGGARLLEEGMVLRGDRKSTRLNSSHRCISYAVFCLKKKKTNHLCRAALRTGSAMPGT